MICAARTSTRSWLGGLQAQVLNQGLKSSSVWKFSATPFKHTFNRQRLGNWLCLDLFLARELLGGSKIWSKKQGSTCVWLCFALNIWGILFTKSLPKKNTSKFLVLEVLPGLKQKHGKSQQAPFGTWFGRGVDVWIFNEGNNGLATQVTGMTGRFVEKFDTPLSCHILPILESIESIVFLKNPSIDLTVWQKNMKIK